MFTISFAAGLLPFVVGLVIFLLNVVHMSLTKRVYFCKLDFRINTFTYLVGLYILCWFIFGGYSSSFGKVPLITGMYIFALFCNVVGILYNWYALYMGREFKFVKTA